MKIIIAVLALTLSSAVMAQNPPMQGIFVIPPKITVIDYTTAKATARPPVRLLQQRQVQGWRNPAYNTNGPKTFNKGIYVVPRLRLKTLIID